MSSGIIVGAAGGIGSAATRALAGSADLLILAGRREPPLKQLANTIPGRSTVVGADIASDAGRRAISAAVEEPIRWLVLASGIPLRKKLTDASEEEIAATFQTNLIGPTLLLRTLLGFKWETPATITIIGSVSASRALPHRGVYGASKAGLEHLARSLAAELAPTQQRVNIVAPGVIATPFLGDDADSLQRWVEARVPTGRSGTPEEVASLVRYATLDAPAYLTGARIPIDGGLESQA